ncbi:MAG: hypothetical protein HY735_28135 [Verrucomicrobia bacterium]|nr:hypothetical protein [Verrucomicrobiota bacterium]
MTEATLRAQLAPIVQSYRRFQLWRGLTHCWGWAALAGAALLLLYGTLGWWIPILMPLLLAATLIAASIIWVRTRRLAPAHRWIAQQIEAENPKLNTVLLAAVEQEPDSATGEFGYLQQRVIEEALAQNQKQPWIQKHLERLFYAQCAHFCALAVFAALAAGLFVVTPKGGSLLDVVRDVTVTPGDTAVERGSSLVVLVRFRGPVPAEADLVVDSSVEPRRRIPLAKNLDDPVFGGTISEIKADAAYHIEYGNDRTGKFKVSVFDYPALQRADATLTYPDYTGQPAKTIEDTRRISAVEGTTLDYSFQLNKPVASASLVARDKTAVPLVPDQTRSNIVTVKMKLEQSKIYELKLVDDAGRTNKVPADVIIDVLPNRPPELKIAFPRQDMRVSPLEELKFQASAADDFGLKAFGLAYTLAGHETKYVEMGQTAAANEKKQLDHLLALEDLSAEPDQLLTYFVWADDFGSDGQIRRTSSDMLFAEVRHFEEIFREGQQAAGGSSEQQGGGQRSPSERLAELQKQIINATWKLQRQETKAKPSAEFKKDVSVVRQSQKQALDQAKEQQSRSENPRLKPLIETVLKEMDQALTHLTEAGDRNTAKPLPSALAAEQAAYQALLKLQAREYQVSRGGRGGGGGGGGGGQRFQDQLDQLELKQSQNRYETQRQASLQQSPEQREELQFLNRLKELARRQLDLNQRLQELQTALQEAKTEDEREAVRRELKRLRDEEQEMVDDVDELRQRMNRAQNQSQLAESRQQLEQSREQIRRTAQELEKGAVSQALASGTRAQRDLQQLRDDFRKRTSSQFTEEMRQLRSDARQLAQREEDLAKKIEEMSQARQRTLSDTAERNALAEQLGEQKSGLTNLVTNVRRVTEQSEAAEPLLSRQLYDTWRRADQTKANSGLDASAELLRRGFVPQASEAEKPVRAVFDQLKRGVERAAESVLGDEAEALRMARNELDDLTQQLDREIAQANPNAGQASSQSGQQNAAEQGTSPNAEQARQERQSSEQSQNSASNQNSREQSGQQAGSERGNQQSQSARNSPGQGGNQGQRGQRRDGQSQQAAERGRSGEQGRAGQNQGGERGGSGQRGSSERRSLTAGGPNSQRDATRQPGFRRDGGGTSGGGPEFLDRFGGWNGPLTGPDYTQWADRLRNVEEMVDVPEVRNRIEQVLDRARGMRVELKRHSKEPQWDLVKAQILEPLVEVRHRISEELARRESSDPMVPIDRDPVPRKFSDLVRRYYETLGGSQN